MSTDSVSHSNNSIAPLSPDSRRRVATAAVLFYEPLLNHPAATPSISIGIPQFCFVNQLFNRLFLFQFELFNRLLCVCEQLICVGINRVYVYVLTGCIVVFIKTNQLCDVFIYMYVCVYLHTW